MIGKIHITENTKIFACCDKELLDTKIKYNDIDIFISSSFFGKDSLTEKEILDNINDCDCANVFGNKICDLLLKEKLILKEQIIYLGKIAHAQIYKL